MTSPGPYHNKIHNNSGYVSSVSDLQGHEHHGNDDADDNTDDESPHASNEKTAETPAEYRDDGDNPREGVD